MILGLDMATKKTGYGLLDEEANLYDYGVIRTINSEPRDRIKEIYDAIEEIINNNNTDSIRTNILRMVFNISIMFGFWFNIWNHKKTYKSKE